jgi:Flp pilus assembly pilin Flp
MLNGKKGQGMTEYILIIALIAVMVIGAVKLFGKQVKKGFADSTSKVQGAIDSGINNSDKPEAN